MATIQNPLPLSDASPGDPGIVVFGSSMVVQYANPRAKAILTWVEEVQSHTEPKEDLLSAIIDIGFLVRGRLYSHLPSSDEAPREAYKAVRTAGGLFELYAFGIQHVETSAPFQIMVVMNGAPTTCRHEPTGIQKPYPDGTS